MTKKTIKSTIKTLDNLLDLIKHQPLITTIIQTTVLSEKDVTDLLGYYTEKLHTINDKTSIEFDNINHIIDELNDHA